MGQNKVGQSIHNRDSRRKRKRKGDWIQKKKPICESNNKHKEQKKEKHDVKRGHQNHKMWGRKVRKCGFLFFRMCVSLYDYQPKASRYRKGLTYLKNGAPTNQKHTIV